MTFCYNTRRCNIVANDKYPVKFEKYDHNIYFFINKNGKKHYLTMPELVQLRKSAQWYIENLDCNFGKEINELLNEKNAFLSA